jgi:hypothetical protein
VTQLHADPAGDRDEDCDCGDCAEVSELAMVCALADALEAQEAFRWTLVWLFSRRRPGCLR